MAEDRLKIAVFIDFDNIEIGVKTTLSRRLDIGTVLEAIKERGEVVTKIAYGNWQRAENYSRDMAEHAVQMVQRNLTPGGDKNGADIHLALDALEMAFTRDHINAFVIVGGDSDFISLVEKLKQYDKTVLIVGGRAFTSVILQKNCHEFIAYENLVGVQPARRSVGKSPVAQRLQLEDALTPIRRALKILADREVSPQLGLLKSTLLQLDSTFSERDFGAGTFRDFMQKLADAGFVILKQVDRSLIVELKDGDGDEPEPVAPAAEAAESEQAVKAPIPVSIQAPPQGPAHVQAHPQIDMAEAMRYVKQVFTSASLKPRWPLYIRGLRQFLRSADPSFNDQHYGMSTLHELARQFQREGLFRLERSREGVLRIFPTDRFIEELSGTVVPVPADPELTAPEPEPAEPGAVQQPEVPAAPPVLDVAEIMPEVPPVEPSPEGVPEEKSKRRRKPASPSATRRKPGGIRKTRAPRK